MVQPKKKKRLEKFIKESEKRMNVLKTPVQFILRIETRRYLFHKKGDLRKS